MDILLVLFCIVALFVPTAVGIGITLLLERFFGQVAYVVGGVLSLLVFAGLYAVYHIWVRATACEPFGSLACGEPFANALFLFLGVLCFAVLANASAQFAVYLRLHPPATPPFGETPQEQFVQPQPTEEQSYEPVPIAEQPLDDQATEQMFVGPVMPDEQLFARPVMPDEEQKEEPPTT